MLVTDSKGGDNIFMNFRVYIEGVEVPFETASIRSVYQQLPEATITIPPYHGMEQLGRNYFPKVHIFYLDPNEAKMKYQVSGSNALSKSATISSLKSLGFSEEEIRDMPTDTRVSLLERSGYKLIFSGVINGCMEAKAMTAGGASQTISFQAVHPYYVLQEILLQYVGLTLDPQGDVGNKMNVAKASMISQPMAIMRALHGIKSGGSPVEDSAGEDAIHCLSKPYQDRFHRLKGCPGALVVLWQMLKRDVFHRGLQAENTQSFKELYIPLVDEGIKLFSRMAGHSVLEEALQSGRSSVSPSTEPSKGTSEEEGLPEDVIIPPPFRTFVAEAATLKLAVQQALQNMYGGDQMATSYYDLVKAMLGLMEYDLLVLNSPVTLSSNGGEIIESIVKPHMPYYYAPICNVLLPNLYESFSIQHNSSMIPTRIVIPDTFIQNINSNTAGGMSVSFIAPHSVRLGMTKDGTLGGTLFSMNNKVGRYEWGSGIRAELGSVPEWYAYYAGDQQAGLNAGGDAGDPTSDAGGLNKAIQSWNSVYPGHPTMNPWDAGTSGIAPWQAITYRQADFAHTNAYAGSRVATVQGVFNPYIIVGYPMDVLDPSPMRSSYHGFCTSVSHEISASGYSGTSIGMAACLSYEELSSCYTPLTTPWLSIALKFTEDTRIFNNRPAYEVACAFYSDVLGVGAADPYLLVNYELGKALPVSRVGGVWTQGVELEHSEALPGRAPWYSVQGSLNLVARNIVSLPQVEAEHADSEGRRFIDIDMWNIGSVKVLSESRVDMVKPSDATGSAPVLGIEMERSPFLDYPDGGEE